MSHTIASRMPFSKRCQDATFQKTSKYRTPPLCNWLDFRQSIFLNSIEACNSSSVKTRWQTSLPGLSHQGPKKANFADWPFTTNDENWRARVAEFSASILNSARASDEALLLDVVSVSDEISHLVPG
jgi:hypothetical protein